ncbi:Hypothetical Protein FCC1311_091782 [Hondaea fermentalgiana]|uniref:SAM domain-containing protein n=1 Tax=Hondaea fermentalgiana TaxID=2315210 RepID=A0A2R5GPZ7_9STRA|nr:Hypothetical Protein FCC1311_091782 [Hondaea fermentalgiana]|eukprot:GBG32952.1 Hypothetical Protein FCC1311_091782 [Hondaea fermentalgiana]
MEPHEAKTHAPVPPTQSAGQAPSAQPLMQRESSDGEGDCVDPVRVLSSLEQKQMHELTKMNVKELANFMSRLQLKEIPRQVQKHGINGSILHTLTSKDIDKMSFDSLGEAKALENLCSSLNTIDRENQRAMVIKEAPLVFWGKAHEWYEGPCSVCNRCAMKNYRGNCDSCWDAVCCSPKQFVELPPSTLRIYRDHLTIEQGRWKDQIDEKYRKLNHAFAPTNEPPFKTKVDNIDFSMIADVDLEIIQKQETYKRSCADCTNVLCCNELKQEPNKGDFYWATPCQRCCGYDLYYKQRPEGYVTITLRGDGDQEGNVRKIGILEDADEAVKAIMHHMEESQMLRALKVH